MQGYIVIPSGDTVGDYPGVRNQTMAHTPELAVLNMARIDFKEFNGGAETAYDVYTHTKKPAMVGTYPCPPEADLIVPDPIVKANKACGCGDDNCKHTNKEAELVKLLVEGGASDPTGLAKRILELLR